MKYKSHSITLKKETSKAVSELARKESRSFSGMLEYMARFYINREKRR
jgi:predicted transcriptional regulator